MTKEFKPQPGPQTAFLASTADITVYGGAAGGGKSYGLLLDFARHIDHPQYRGVIFRRTYPQIAAGGGLWDESMKIYPHLGGRPSTKDFKWTFPSGAEIKLTHLQHDKNKLEHQGAQYVKIGWDELTHFEEAQFWYLMSRNRTTSGLPTSIRCTTNPDGKSWVKKFLAPWVDQKYRRENPIAAESGEIRYMLRKGDQIEWMTPEYYKEWHARNPDRKLKSVTFISSRLSDNKILMEQNPEYKENLMSMTTVDRKRLLDGDWEITDDDLLFARDWFKVVEPNEIPWQRLTSFCRYWDLAATEKEEDRKACFTAGALLARDFVTGDIYILDVIRKQYNPVKVRNLVHDTIQFDLSEVWHGQCNRSTYKVRMEQEPGATGKIVIDDFAREIIGVNFEGDRPTGDKLTRAKPLAQKADQGRVYIRKAGFTEDFLNEIETYPAGLKDQTDAVSGALPFIARTGGLAFA